MCITKSKCTTTTCGSLVLVLVLANFCQKISESLYRCKQENTSALGRTIAPAPILQVLQQTA